MTLKILHVLDHSAPLHSGYAFRTAAILREQRALGWTGVPVTGVKQEGCTVAEEVVDGVRYFRTAPPAGPLGRWPVVREAAGVRQLERRVLEIALREKPDLIHAYSPVLCALAAGRAARSLRLPFVYEVRALWEDAAVDHGTQRAGSLRYRATRSLETRAARGADALTVICDGLRREFVARGVPAERITVIPNAVDTEQFTPEGTRDEVLAKELGLNGSPVLGFIGSFYGYEGLPILLRGFALLLEREPEARLLLVGGGPDDDLLRALARELGIGERVVFTGRVPNRDVNRYYDLIDLLVYPRRSTRTTEMVTPLKPLEAMAQGRLFAASDVGGHRELIRDGETGVLFRAEDPASLAETVGRLWSERDRWPALLSTARAFVERERRWASSVRRYEAVYAGALERNRAR